MKKIMELKNILEGQLEIYINILSLCKEKKEVLIKADVKKLEELIEKEQKLVLKIGELEDKRYDNLMKIKEEINDDVENINLTQLVKKLDPKNETNIVETQKEMSSILEQIEKLNQQNSLLIEQALKHIDQSINIMAASREDDSGRYEGNTNNQNKKDSKSFLDYKV